MSLPSPWRSHFPGILALDGEGQTYLDSAATAQKPQAMLDAQNQLVKVVKARELAGQPDLLFRRNSQTGSVECKTHKSAIELNEALHAHN